MSRRAETDLEREGLAIGALLAAADLERARRIAAVLPPPAALLDPSARAALTLSLDMLTRGELPSAATVFVEGTAGTRALFSAEDRERLRSWQIDAELTDDELVTIGKQLHRGARVRRLGQLFKALGVAIETGRAKDGSSFGPDQARAWFDRLAADYNTAHAEGMSGSDAVLATRARYEQDKKLGRDGYTKSGIPLFDKIFGGYPKKLVYMLGAGGAGKSTWLGTQLDLHQRMGVRSVLSSMEDNHEWVVTRHIALMLGLKMRETYSGPFPDEEKALEAELLLHERWKNLQILTKRHGASVDDHLRLWAQHIVQNGASVFYMDNMSVIEHQLQGRHDTIHASAGRSLEKLAAFCDVWHVTAVVYAHTKDEWFSNTGGKEPPELRHAADTGGGIQADRHSRQGWGVWSMQAGELRVTCIKNTADGRLAIERKTIAVDVHADQGLFDPDTAREVNLKEERRRRDDEKQRQSKLTREERFRESKQRTAAFKAEELAKKEAAAAAELAKKPQQIVAFEAETLKERT